MMIELFLFKLLYHPDLSDPMFWIAGIVYLLLIIGAYAGK